MLKLYRFIRQSWAYIGPLVGLWGLSRALNYSLLDLWHGLIAILPLLLSLKIVYLFVFLFAVYLTYLQILYRKIPITILSTDVQLFLETAAGDEARLCRTQVLRANR